MGRRLDVKKWLAIIKIVVISGQAVPKSNHSSSVTDHPEQSPPLYNGRADYEGRRLIGHAYERAKSRKKKVDCLVREVSQTVKPYPQKSLGMIV
ncbi:hypothetical protein CEXT_584211 [Caerostris extrusa]|uniref:Uncharacterized protein n=1 Tax=Caerostris extrusa TaxID=172846 RepID=A0AAV4T0P1_CAEEX|nr:hypothetical protein CEXT_584211 [Caerostris extrusa]